jgi:hypothetical protein
VILTPGANGQKGRKLAKRLKIWQQSGNSICLMFLIINHLCNKSLDFESSASANSATPVDKKSDAGLVP